MFISTFLISLFTIVELNCENLFDWQHDTLKNDYEYLPDSYRHWTKSRFWRKLDNTARTIIACGGDSTHWSLPDMVALCEVENDTVLHYLTRRSLLRTAYYEYVMTDSPDDRGIDVALLYSPLTFRLLGHHSVRVDSLQTRDMLYVRGLVRGIDTLHVIVLHAPSRMGGERESRPKRMIVARRVCSLVDSIRAQSPHADIVVAGDFNDYTRDKPLLTYKRHGLVDVTRDATGTHGARATYRYKGKWGSLDHIYASPHMAERCKESHVCDAPFLLTEDEKFGGYRPRRNYVGMKWQNAYSDHLPLVANFEY